MEETPSLIIYVKGRDDADFERINDLYWFEEQGVQKWDGVGHFDCYKIEIRLNDQILWKNY